jgi:SAM-dependent methyltransferase
MAERVCPWWLGYLLASPLRRLWHNPTEILASYVRPGMTVLEPGPGMGFFTLEMARLVGRTGRVVVVDIQPKMLASLKRRTAKQGLLERVDIRLVGPDSLGIPDLAGQVDFALAFALVHEIPDPAKFFREVSHTLKPGAVLLLAEPTGHLRPGQFDEEVQLAAQAGIQFVKQLSIRRSQTALLQKAG